MFGHLVDGFSEGSADATPPSSPPMLPLRADWRRLLCRSARSHARPTGGRFAITATPPFFTSAYDGTTASYPTRLSTASRWTCTRRT